MKTKALLITAFVALVTFDSPATIFRLLTGDNTKINADWSATESGAYFSPVTDGSPTKPWISMEHYGGSNSIGIQVPTDNTGNKERFEYKILQATDTNGLHFDNARYAGFAFKLAPSPAPFTNSTIFWQAWQGSPWGPPVSLKFATDSSAPYRVRLCIRNTSVGPNSSVPDIELWAGSIIYPDTWNTVIIYLKPRYNTNGTIRLWINGINYTNWTGEIGYDPSQVANTYNGLDIKNGIYQPDADNGHTIYFDQLIVADNYAEVSGALTTNNPSRPTLSGFSMNNGSCHLSVNGNVGFNYSIQSSTDLFNWTELLITNPPGLPFQFVDTANGFDRRFYRASVGR